MIAKKISYDSIFTKRLCALLPSLLLMTYGHDTIAINRLFFPFLIYVVNDCCFFIPVIEACQFSRGFGMDMPIIYSIFSSHILEILTLMAHMLHTSILQSLYLKKTIFLCI